MNNRAPLSERFWRNVERSGPDECWLWKAAKDKDGYGWIRANKKNDRSNRVAWMLAHGSIPAGSHVLHSCDNPGCVNLAHLRLGTDEENRKDKLARKRQARGESHGCAKLTEKQVLEIRALHGMRLGQIAVMFGVSPDAIGRIIKRKDWTHI